MPDEDGFDDIEQQEARDDSYLSQHSDEQCIRLLQESKSPWKRIARTSAHQGNLSSSPAYVTMEHDDARYFDQTHIRKLRDQEVDLSAILAEEDTPNRARYYNGTSTPRSILRRPGLQSSINGSAMRPTSQKPEKRVRLQPIPKVQKGIRKWKTRLARIKTCNFRHQRKYMPMGVFQNLVITILCRTLQPLQTLRTSKRGSLKQPGSKDYQPDSQVAQSPT